MMSDELKPCPCCGSDDVALMPHSTGESVRFYVQCGDCVLKTGHYSSESEAIAAWNDRPAPKADSALVEKLRNPLWSDCNCHLTMDAAADEIERLAALSDRDVVLERLLREAAASLASLLEPLQRASEDMVAHGKTPNANADATLDHAAEVLAHIDAALKGGVDE